MNEYVDIRGVWPVYVCGVWAVQLPGKPRDISVDDARAVARAIHGVRDRFASQG